MTRTKLGTRRRKVRQMGHHGFSEALGLLA